MKAYNIFQGHNLKKSQFYFSFAFWLKDKVTYKMTGKKSKQTGILYNSFNLSFKNLHKSTT